MKFPNLTSTIAKYFSFLKEIPLLPILIDEQIRLFTFIFKLGLFFLMSEIIKEIKTWEGISIHTHRYGGIEFRIKNKEIGHLHGGGLLDILFDKDTKDELFKNKQISEHHVFKNTGWGSFYICENSDFQEIIHLLKISFMLKK
jgi:hypothetical protein